MVERPAVNRRVVGSNPTRGAIRLARLPAGSLMISEHSPSFPLREETQHEHCAMGSADSAGRPVCHRGPVEDCGTGTDARKMMPGFSLALIRLVGLGETLAGLGLVLPSVARMWGGVAG